MADTPDAGAPSTPLARYAHTVRRQRIVYFSVVTAIVVAVGVIVAVAWSRGETANTTLRTVSSAPPSLALATPAPSPKRAWHTSDRAAIGSPQSGGTVVVFGAHTVRGVDARTGDKTWSYRRSNRTVCTAAQAGGVAMVVYELAGNCDEVTALDSGTGKRRWTRTLDMDGMPLNGRPAFQVSSQGGFQTLLARSKSVIYALDPASGYNRWTYSRYGCTISGAVLGSNGALISQTCSTKVQCGQQKFCGPGPQLLLRNAYDGRDDKSDSNPDKITWNLIGTRSFPVSADGLVADVDTSSGTLVHRDEKDGAVQARTRLIPRPETYSGRTATQVSDVELVWIGGRTYAIRSGTATALWATDTPAPPEVVSTDPNSVPVIPDARVTVPTGDGVRLLDARTGETDRAFTLTAPPPGSSVYSMGAGFLVAAPHGTTAYLG